MPTYVVNWEHGPSRVRNVDAYAVTLRVRRDGEDLGLWDAIASGPQLSGRRDADDPRFWPAAALVGARLVEEDVRLARPDAWQEPVRRLDLLVRDAESVMDQPGVGLPAGPSDDPIHTFDAP